MPSGWPVFIVWLKACFYKVDKLSTIKLEIFGGFDLYEIRDMW